MDHRRTWGVVAAVVVSALVLATGFYVFYRPNASPAARTSGCGPTPGPPLSSENLTGRLPTSFVNGSIQAFGSNDTSVIFGGVSFYDRNHLPYDSLPALGSFTPGTTVSRDLTAQTSAYFAEGGVFPVGWNGSAWLIAGQTTIGNTTEGSAISFQNGVFTNLTSLVAPYFQGQGIWIAGWNGEGWLLGGNSTEGAALVYLQGSSVVNLTSLIPDNAPGKWIQALAWNGSGWLVGGQGVFGAYEGGRFTNLLGESPFGTGGVLAMDWNGSAWLVGGSPLALAYVHGDEVEAAPSLGIVATGWANSVVALPGGDWLVAGGTDSGGGYAPFLTALNASAAVPIDEATCLPGAFAGGWVQYGTWAPAFGPHELLLVGEGGTDPSTFASHAAAAVLTVGG